jgi:hypothetical protein
MSAAPNKPSALINGRQVRRYVRVEQAARLTIKGFGNIEIASMMGIHVQTLVYLKQTPEFKNRIIQMQTGVIAHNNVEIEQDLEYQKQALGEMVPMALMKLRELAMSNNQAIALKASQDILQRQGDHAIVSRTSIKVEKTPDMSEVNQISNSILDMLRNSPPQIQQENIDITEEFTKGAIDSDKAVLMMKEFVNEDTLEKIDASKLPVQ